MELQLEKINTIHEVSTFNPSHGLSHARNIVNLDNLKNDLETALKNYEEKYNNIIDESTLSRLENDLANDVSNIMHTLDVDSKVNIVFGDIKEDGSLPVSINIIPLQKEFHTQFVVKDDKSYRLYKRYKLMKKKGKMKCVY